MEFNLEKEGVEGLLRNATEFENTLEDILSEDDRILSAEVSLLSLGSDATALDNS